MKKKLNKLSPELIAQEQRASTRTVLESYDDAIKDCLHRMEALHAAKASLPVNLANMKAEEAVKLLQPGYFTF